MTLRRRRSRFRSALALGALLAAALSSRQASAQACCAGGATYNPGRLQLFEDAAVAVGVRVVNPWSNQELDLEQDFIGTVRVLKHGQIGVVIPLVETYLGLSGRTDTGGGIGDVTLTARYDLV